MGFYLGSHRPSWLGREDLAVPLFVSHQTLKRRVSLPRRPAGSTWALDSGGFTELSTHGRWTIPAWLYASCARRYMDEIGGMDFAAIQDHMCEPFILEKTGRSIEEHQTSTIDSLFELQSLEPGVPWLPVIQGFREDDYLRHVDEYDRRGVDLRSYAHVGVGSICRRQATREAARILRRLSQMGIRVHAFGLKLGGVEAVSDCLASSDSMAWSYDARRSPPLEGCAHKSCANCPRYAMMWRARVLSLIEKSSGYARQGELF